jgi:hypothetical protein
MPSSTRRLGVPAVVAGLAALAVTTIAMAMVVTSILDVRPDPLRRSVAREWAWPLPDSHGVIFYESVTTTPAPTGHPAPGVSDAEAVRILQTAGLARATPTKPRVTLRLATAPHGLDGGEGFTGRLAWIVEYPHQPLLLSGPPGLTDEGRLAIQHLAACEGVLVVDATDATVLASVAACHVPARAAPFGRAPASPHLHRWHQPLGARNSRRLGSPGGRTGVAAP